MKKSKMPPRRSREPFTYMTGGEKKDPDKSIRGAFESSAGKPSDAPSHGVVYSSD